MEPIEDPQNYRLFIKPDSNNPVFKRYKLVQANFWVEDEFNGELQKDSTHWINLDPKIKKLLLHQIAFFVIGDGIVNQTISNNIDSRIMDREIQLWYNFQKMMEDIHNIAYVKLIDTYVPDPQEKDKILDAIKNYPTINKKINWLKKWLGSHNDIHNLDIETLETIRKLKDDLIFNSEKYNFQIPSHYSKLFNKISEPQPSIGLTIYINIIMEGLQFQKGFLPIFWINHHFKGMLPGLTKSNEFISRDEGSHVEFGIYLYNYKIVNKLSQVLIHNIMKEAVEIEIEDSLSSLPEGLINMNIQLMEEYIKFLADQILYDLKYEKIYHVKNPFQFMDKQSVSIRISDFFIDHNVSEYAHHSSGVNPEDQELSFDENFL